MYLVEVGVRVTGGVDFFVQKNAQESLEEYVVFVVSNLRAAVT
jgi:hypothetical protein